MKPNVVTFRRADGARVELLVRTRSLREREALADDIRPDPSCKPTHLPPNEFGVHPRPNRRRRPGARGSPTA